MASAFGRKVREGTLPPRQRDRFWRRFRLHHRLQYRTISLEHTVLAAAERLLFARALTAADAVQVASALWAARLIADLVGEFQFLTADRSQAAAATSEGLAVELIV